METAINALKELAELLRTRFREVAIIALCFCVYKQQMYIVKIDANYKVSMEKKNQQLEDKNQQVINMFKNILEKQQQVLYKADRLVQRTDTLVSKVKK